LRPRNPKLSWRISRRNTVKPRRAWARWAIAATKDFEGVTGKITIDAQRNPQKSAVVLKIEDGKAKFETSIAP